MVPFVHLLASSNQHLLYHEFNEMTEFGARKRMYPSDAIPQRKRASVNQQDLLAVKKRFIEIFVRKQPALTDLPKNGSFSR